MLVTGYCIDADNFTLNRTLITWADVDRPICKRRGGNRATSRGKLPYLVAGVGLQGLKRTVIAAVVEYAVAHSWSTQIR
ncbi:hypothetical protein BH23CHL5_BH23CHL5_23710 [soil metagenome]